jgi:hypothetical protein
MKKYNGLMAAAIMLVLLGMVIIYLGAFKAPQIMLPPVITGIGFFVIAWAFIKMRN